MKIVKKQRLEIEDIDGLNQEISILQELQHPNILSFNSVFDEGNNIYIVTEMMHGGDLYERITMKSFYEERKARDVCQILFETIQYCHKHKIAHRDLKPENILLTVSKLAFCQRKLHVITEMC